MVSHVDVSRGLTRLEHRAGWGELQTYSGPCYCIYLYIYIYLSLSLYIYIDVGVYLYIYIYM